ncbi:class I mannose-6-phosphate isomerase [Roseixanthobacter pseudopolyaromaticivorans]|uniref:class I mannose-6-phosphate isomerase n=1 Tax=Xanthobacteraceae TaxID=335928 RepID=UPI00372BF1F5
MAIEQACVRVVRKPWGSTDLLPWRTIAPLDGAVGELWFERADPSAPETALLLKLLFTTQPLSIQVHPDDAFARTLGQEHGKSEAWYILSAQPGAQVAVGLNGPLTPSQLRTAIEDRSIAARVQWRDVLKGDVVCVPAGTIHAIGAGLVIAEIQQRSDVTFRLFDYGRSRELHAEQAVAATHMAPLGPQAAPRALGNGRTLLAVTPHFVIERLDLAPSVDWSLDAPHETWMLMLEGSACVAGLDVTVGGALFLQGECAPVRAGGRGAKALVAYAADVPHPDLLAAGELPAVPTRAAGFAAPTQLFPSRADSSFRASEMRP